MALNSENKKTLIDSAKLHDKDTGSSSVQIALLTERINQLTEHFKAHKKDHHSRRGLIKMVSKRKRLLEYLKKHNLDVYNELTKNLKIRT
jgi:small subunit ribosomal protein S15